MSGQIQARNDDIRYRYSSPSSEIVICLLPKHLGVLMNSPKRFQAFQIELEFGSVGFWGEGKTGKPKRNLSEQRENQQQTQPAYGFDAGIWTRAKLEGGECSHQCETPAPQALQRAVT